MRVFVTGISSHMGQRIAEGLVSNGDEVMGLTRKKDFRIKGCHIVTGALERSHSYSAKLTDLDLIIHVAGITHSDKPDQYYAVNADAGGRLISLAEASGVKRFIYISTRAIGPGCGAYGESKRMIERRLQMSNLDWVILRVAEVYGVKKNEGINALMAQVLRKKVIPIPGNGEFMVTPVHVGDVAAAVCAISGASGIRMETYTLCGPKTYSINGFISVMCQIIGLRRVGILIPLFVVRLAMGLKRFFPTTFHITRDQIQRLTVAKETDFSQAAHDFGFSPIGFESWFRDEVKAIHDVKIAMGENAGIKIFPGVILFRGSVARE